MYSSNYKLTFLHSLLSSLLLLRAPHTTKHSWMRSILLVKWQDVFVHCMQIILFCISLPALPILPMGHWHCSAAGGLAEMAVVSLAKISLFDFTSDLICCTCLLVRFAAFSTQLTHTIGILATLHQASHSVIKSLTLTSPLCPNMSKGESPFEVV